MRSNSVVYVGNETNIKRNKQQIRQDAWKKSDSISCSSQNYDTWERHFSRDIFFATDAVWIVAKVVSEEV